LATGVGINQKPAKRKRFQSGLEYLAEKCSIVPLDEFVSRRASRRQLFKPELALTFDDGLRDQFTYAYPLLKRLGIPATFFVCANLIETGQWLWTKAVRARLQCLSSEQKRILSTRLDSCSAEVEATMRWLKALPLGERQTAEEAIREATPDFHPSFEQCEEFDQMSWTELASLDSSLITIGSHTMNHPVLTLLDAEELDTEIRESRTLLEEKLHRPVRHLCYPEGRHDRTVRDCVRRYYSTAVSTVPGRVLADTDVYSLPRVPAIFAATLILQRKVFRATA
jgi:peptidoglycan/xylan/chitin deacetylase (PgdA/CDA1 family)